MFTRLTLKNVGPAEEMALELGNRLNLLTGDNGLGKSFLLDIAWWVMTRQWPWEINPRLSTGRMARPTHPDNPAHIASTIVGRARTVEGISRFDRSKQRWIFPKGPPPNPGLVLYSQADGSFAVWDPTRNANAGGPQAPPAYVFTPGEVWHGLKSAQGSHLCNGLIFDWAGWQKEKGETFSRFQTALKTLSAGPEEITTGELTRISLSDTRDIPTLRMPYGQDVPILDIASGMRRIITLAYLLVWAWEEHLKACDLLGLNRTDQITFLIDEIESHLHPKWQRQIVKTLLKLMGTLADDTQVQLVIATHSPLIMVSVEPLFDATTDAWFDLDLEIKTGKVQLTRREFLPRGDASDWLISEAFDLNSSRALETERLLEEASNLINGENPDRGAVHRMHKQLLKALNELDPYLFRWRYLCEKKGLLP